VGGGRKKGPFTPQPEMNKENLTSKKRFLGVTSKKREKK